MSDRILVTGGAGYVGSHACKALASAGYLPVVFDNLSHGYAEFVRWGPLEIGDLADREALRAAVRRHQPIAVFHFAGLIGIGESVAEPELYKERNVGTSKVLLEVLRENAVKRLVLSSSCAVYGTPARLPITEDCPLAPINPYGETKRTIEDLVRGEAANGLASVTLRYFNAAGADPEGEIGESHNPETHLIPLVLAAASGEIEAIDILGVDYPTPDGTAIRDYVHVADLAQAHVLALQSLSDSPDAMIFNLGSGRGASVREIIDAAATLTGRTIPVRERPRRPGDVPTLVADAGKVLRQLGWSPASSDIRSILATAWAWHQRRTAAVRQKLHGAA